MKSILICYDLNSAGQDNTELIDQIKNLCITRWHQLDSIWIFNSDLTVEHIRDILKKHINRNDKFLVTELTSVAAWTRFNAQGSNWLIENLKW